ncbi:MAG: ABC transporter substrate-binding protein [Candidatus Sumerlaeaceae bacterium]
MNKKMKLACLLGCIVALATGAPSKDVVKFLSAEYSTATGPYWKEVEAAFEQANPDIDLQVEVSYWKGLHDKITTLIGAKNQPDLAIIGTSWLPEYVKEGVAQQIDDRLTSSFRDRFVQNLLQGAAMNGRTYGLPVATSARALYYNKQLLEQAGLQPPTNWDELKAVAKKVTKRPKVYGLAMPIHQDDQADTFDYFLWAAGGDWFDAQGNVVLNSPESVEALQFMVDLYKEGLTNPEPWTNNRDEQHKLFFNGRAAMIQTGNFMIPSLEKNAPNLQYGVTAIPKKRKPGTLAVTDTLVFFNRDGQNREAVWKFIDFAYQRKWREEFMKRESMLPELKELASQLESDPKLGAFVKLLPDAKFQPNHESFMPISQRLVKAIQLALLGQKPAKQALDEAVEDINKNILKK